MGGDGKQERDRRRGDGWEGIGGRRRTGWERNEWDWKRWVAEDGLDGRWRGGEWVVMERDRKRGVEKGA